MAFVDAHDSSSKALREISKENSIFVLAAGTTELSKIPGITAAGASPELTSLTPAVDAEIMYAGRCISLDVPPMTPEGIPTPALISRACISLLGMPVLIVDAGFTLYPKVPHVRSNLGSSLDPRTSPALPAYEDAVALGKYIATLLDGKYSNIIMAESIPGGTTTAYFILKLLGHNVKSSSSMPVDPDALKQEIFQSATENLGAPNSPSEIMRNFGDYVTSTTVSAALNIHSSRVFLSGGTQMVAAYLLARRMGKGDDMYLGTSRWVREHRPETVSLVPRENLIISNPDFSGLHHPGLTEYERGHVKEGVGMGFALALGRGAVGSDSELYRAITRLYQSFLQTGHDR